MAYGPTLARQVWRVGGSVSVPILHSWREPGLWPGQDRAASASFELGRRLMAEAPDERYQIRAPADAANILMPLIAHQNRTLHVLYPDTATASSTRNALQREPQHLPGTDCQQPSRCGAPSARRCLSRTITLATLRHRPRTRLTRRLVDARQPLDVDLLDHIVIGHNRFVSLRERGRGLKTHDIPMSVPQGWRVTAALLRVRKNITSRILRSKPVPGALCAGTYSFTSP